MCMHQQVNKMSHYLILRVKKYVRKIFLHFNQNFQKHRASRKLQILNYQNWNK